jgi:hypothetical protein
VQAPEAFAQGLIRDQRLELPDHLVVAPEPEVGLDAVLVGHEAQLIEPRGLALGERLVAQVGEGRPAPQSKRLAQQLGGLAERAAAQRSVAFLRQLLEALRIELAGVDAEPVRGPFPRQAVGDDLAQLRDVDLERVRGRCGRLVAPQILDQQLGRNGLVPAQHQQCQQGARFLAFDGQRRALQHYLDRAQDAVLQAVPPAAG